MIKMQLYNDNTENNRLAYCWFIATDGGKLLLKLRRHFVCIRVLYPKGTEYTAKSLCIWGVQHKNKQHVDLGNGESLGVG